MLSFTTMRNLYGDLTGNDSSTNLTHGDLLINQGIRKMLGSFDWPFLRGSEDITTVASQQAYDLPSDMDKLVSVYVTVSSQRYIPTEVTSSEQWDRLNGNTSVTSDFPTHFFVYGNNLELYPTPASSSNTITVRYKKAQKDLSIADYTTGTITTATNGSTAIVGGSTSWTAKLAENFWINITDSATTNTGDGRWYEVASVGSATAITLEREYRGPSIAAGSAAYTLGQMSLLPENYQIAPVYYATYQYYTRQANGVDRAQQYKQQFDELLTQMRREGSPTTSVTASHGISERIINPNLTLTL